MTASDLLAFARLHLRDGVADSGSRLLSEASARAMREPQIVQPDPSHSPACGYGWAIEHLAPRVVGHIGSTCGQRSRLVVVPDQDLAICVLATGDIQGMGDLLLEQLLNEAVGVSLPTGPSPVEERVDPRPFVGRYWLSDDATVEVRAAGSGLEAAFTTAGRWAAFQGDFSTPMTFAGGSTFLLSMPPVTKPVTATFLQEDGPDRPATHLASQMRVAPRIGAGTEPEGNRA